MAEHGGDGGCFGEGKVVRAVGAVWQRQRTDVRTAGLRTPLFPTTGECPPAGEESRDQCHRRLLRATQSPDKRAAATQSFSQNSWKHECGGCRGLGGRWSLKGPSLGGDSHGTGRSPAPPASRTSLECEVECLVKEVEGLSGAVTKAVTATRKRRGDVPFGDSGRWVTGLAGRLRWPGRVVGVSEQRRRVVPSMVTRSIFWPRRARHPDGRRA